MKKAYLNGHFVDLSDAKISIFDRGFLFGDSIYEVLPVYKGRAFFVDKHLNRLNSNLEKIKIDLPEFDWNEIINRLINENGGGDLQVYLQVTRGDQGSRKHDIPPLITPTVLGFTIHNAYPTLADKELGLRAMLLEDIRWSRCDIKTTSLLGNILLNDEALSSGFQTTILSRDGVITEGSTSNVFIVSKNGTLKTPPLNPYCLPGITRQITIELIHQLNWSLSKEQFDIKELLEAQEVWITSTSKEIFPVIQVNESLIGNGQVGSYWRQIEKKYRELIG